MMKKRILSLVTALCLCLTLMPGEALASTVPADAFTNGKWGIILGGVEQDYNSSSSATFVVQNGGLSKLPSKKPSEPNSLTIEIPNMTVNGDVTLPAPPEGKWGMEMSMLSSGLTISGGNLTVPGGVRVHDYRTTYGGSLTLTGGSLTVPDGAPVKMNGTLELAGGAVLSAPQSGVTGSIVLGENCALTADNFNTAGGELIVGTGSTATFAAGNINVLPSKTEIHGTLSITDTGANRLKYLNPQKTVIHEGGKLLLGGVEMEVDINTLTFVPKGTVDKTRVDYSGLDLSGVTADAHFTTINGGTLDWEQATRTLKLNSVKINKRLGLEPNEESSIILPEGDVTLKLNGVNELVSYGYGVNAKNCSSLTIVGPGELLLNVNGYSNGGSGYYSACGISSGGEVILQSGTVRMAAPASASQAPCAISAGKLTVRGGELNVPFSSTTAANSSAISITRMMDMSGGVVKITAATGIFCMGDLSVSGGSLSINGRSGGILGNRDSNVNTTFSISGGTVNISTNVLYAAIDTRGSISITGGDVTLKGPGGTNRTDKGVLCSSKSDVSAISISGVNVVKPSGARVGIANTCAQYLESDGNTRVAEAQFTSTSARGTLTVVDGGVGATASGSSYTANTTVAISAGNKNSDGLLFDRWTVTGNGTVEDPASANTRVTLTGDCTVTANWVQGYTVTLDAGGKPTGAGKYKAGDTVTVAAGTLIGHVFSGWSCDAADVVFADSKASPTTFTMPARDVTVTAAWELGSYTVTLEGCAPNATGAGTYTWGDQVTIFAGTKDDGIFQSWGVGGPANFKFTAYWDPNPTFTMPAGDVTFVANWIPAFKLTVKNSGAATTGEGTYRQGNRVTASAGTRQEKAPSGAWVTMDFTGWTFDDDSGITFLNNTTAEDRDVQFSMPGRAVTATANWAYPTHQVELKNAGEGATGAGAQKVGHYVEITPGTKANHTFKGWRVNGNNVVLTDVDDNTKRFIMPAEDVLIEALWEEQTFSFKILEGGVNYSPSDIVQQQKFAAGTRVNIYAGVNRGYDFAGWTSDNGGVFADASQASTQFTMPAGAVKLTAHWVKEAVPTLAIYPSSEARSALYINGELHTENPIYLKFQPGTPVTIKAEYPDLPGFRGWVIPAGLTLTEGDDQHTDISFVMPGSYLSLSVNWWKVAFLEIQDVGVGGSEGDYYRKDTVVDIRAGVMPGKTFLYWEDDPLQPDMGSRRFGDYEEKNTTYTMPEGMSTIKAVWLDDDPGTYTLLVKGTDNDLVASKTYAPGEEVTVSAGSREGYLFAYWLSEGITLADQTAETITFTMPSEDVTLQANWTEGGNPVTIRGAGVGAEGAKRYGAGSSVSVYAGEKEGYHFARWEVEPDSVTLSDPTAATVTFTMPDQAVTLTAKWEPELYTLTVKGLPTGEESREVAFGTEAALSAGTREGYVFAGWSCPVEGLLTGVEGLSEAAFTMPARDVTVTATWAPGPNAEGTLTLYLDDYGGDLIIEENQIRDVAAGKTYPHSGPIVLTQRDPDVPTSNSVTVTWFLDDGDFDITLKNVNLAAADDKAAISIQNGADVQLKLSGENILAGGAGHAGIELTSTGGSPDTAVTIHGGEGDSLTVTGGDNAAGIGGAGSMNYGSVTVAGGVINATGGKGAAGIGGGNTYAGSSAGASGGVGSVSISGGQVTATGTPDDTGTYPAEALLGAAGIGAGYGSSVASTVIHISGGDVTATGAGAAPAIGAVTSAATTISGGKVTAASADAPVDIGVHPDGGGTVLTRLSEPGGKGTAVVSVTGADRISDKPAAPVSGEEGTNQSWNGVVFEGSQGQVYRGEFASSTVAVNALNIPQGGTLHIPAGVILQIPEGKLSYSGNPFRGEGVLRVGEELRFVAADGSLGAYEAQLDNTDLYRTLYELLTGELDGTPFLYGDGNAVRLLTDVSYPEDINFLFETTKCIQASLDLSGKTLDMGGHSFTADVAEYPSVEDNVFLLTDTSADGTGKLMGNSDQPLLRTRLGLLVIRGGSYVNTGSGPALRIENFRASAKLEGGSFSSLEATCKGTDDRPIPLVTFLGEGRAFFDAQRQFWISPVSKRSRLDNVTVDAPAAPLAPVTLSKADKHITVQGVGENSGADYRWIARPYEGGEAVEIPGFHGPVLGQDSGLVADGSYYLSCVVTVDGVDVLTDEVFAEMKAPEKTPDDDSDSDGDSSGGSGSSSGGSSSSSGSSGSSGGSAVRPSSGSEGKGAESEPAKVTVTTGDGKQIEVAAEGTVILPITPVTLSGEAEAPVVGISAPVEARVCIPVANATAGTVAVLLRSDGTEEVVKLSDVTGDGLVLTVRGEAKVRVEDRSVAFRDVAGHWVAGDGAVDFVTSRGLFRGTKTNETFSPDEAMTRGMLVTVLHRLAGEPVPAAAGGYLDVSQNWYYAQSVAWATGAGITNGTGDGLFEPDRPVDRETLCMMIYRYAQSVGCAGEGADLTAFSDNARVESWAREGMAWCVGAGILQGRDNGTLDPKREATRAEVAVILHRLVAVILKTA